MRAVDGAPPLRRALAHAYQWVSPTPQGTKAGSGGQSGFPHKEKTWPRRCKGCKWAVACHGHLGTVLSHDACVRKYFHTSDRDSHESNRRDVVWAGWTRVCMHTRIEFVSQRSRDCCLHALHCIRGEIVSMHDSCLYVTVCVPCPPHTHTWDINTTTPRQGLRFLSDAAKREGALYLCVYIRTWISCAQQRLIPPA